MYVDVYVANTDGQYSICQVRPTEQSESQIHHADEPGQTKLHSVEEVKKSVAGSLEKLGFIPNLLLIHNPFIPAEGQLGEFWGWLEDLVQDGTLKGCSLGLSNFRPIDIEAVMKVAKIKPVVNRMYLQCGIG